MVFPIRSLGLRGIDGYEVIVECDISNGLPAFNVGGLPDNAIQESRDRVRSAIKNSGFTFPVSRITINLAPADIKKIGTLYDLPILVGILRASGQLTLPHADCAFLGELSLSGELRPVRGVLPMAVYAKKLGIQSLFVPAANAAEATLAEGPTIYPLQTVRQLIDHLTGEAPLSPAEPWVPAAPSVTALDFSEVKGQESVKRALEIAASGHHNCLMTGVAGSGKSMLAKRLPGILPAMTKEEALETTKIYSVMGLTNQDTPLVSVRPFRSPHHTSSSIAMVGGGANPRPGEISLSHNGVLFLDELPEFPRAVLEVLRQPMEDGTVQISRANGSITYPADFMLICAMNPCKCGWYGHPSGRCRCSENEVRKYLSKLSGPLLDRIDLFVEIAPVEYDALAAKPQGESSAQIKERVDNARKKQERRGTRNAKLTPAALEEYCSLDQPCQEMMRQAFETLGLSARGYDKIRKIARTIADLDDSEHIQARHLAEALQYRAPKYLRK